MRTTLKIVFFIFAISIANNVRGQQNIRYHYDALQRLTQVEYPNGTTVNYTYDVLGNRLSKCVSTTVNAVICPGDVYTLLGETFTTAGDYTVVGYGSNGEEYQILLHLTTYPQLNVSISGETETCIGESVTLTASGGNSYLWSTQATTSTIHVYPQSTTTYTVTCTDENGCSSVSSITVNASVCSPVVSTGTVIQTSNTIAISGGQVLYDGGGEIVARGVCWSTSHNPTIEDDHTSNGTGTGDFSSTLGGLSPLNTYYVRAYATNSANTTYGEEVELDMYLIVPKSVSEQYTMTNSDVVVYDHGGPNNNYDNGCDGTLTITAPSANMILSITGVYNTENHFDKLYVYDGEGTNNLIGTLEGNSSISSPIMTTQNSIALRFTSDVSMNYSGFEIYITAIPLVIPSFVTIEGNDLECDQDFTTLTATSDVEGTFTWSNGMTGEQVTVGEGIYTVTITTSTNAVMVSDPFVVNARHSISSSFTMESCESYEWNENTYYASGSYTQSFLSASGCDSVVTLHLSIFPVPEPIISGNSELCDGEYATLTASGGHSYLWSTGETDSNLSVSETGTYMVTVTDMQNCSATTNFTVTVHPLPTVTISGESIFCAGESSTLTASGAETYEWSTSDDTESIIVSESGSYTVIGTDEHGCTNTATQVITVQTPVNESIDITLCENELPYHYVNGDIDTIFQVNTPSLSSFPFILTTAYGCDSIVELTITITSINTDIAPPPIESTTIMNEITALQEDAEYQWLNCDNNTLIDGANEQSFHPDVSGHYACILTIGDCVDTTLCEEVIVETGIIGYSESSLTVYPNPTDGTATIQLSSKISTMDPEIKVYDVEGRLLQVINVSHTGNKSLQAVKIDLSHYATGIYLVKLENGGEVIAVCKVVKQ